MSARPEDLALSLRRDWEPRLREFASAQPGADPAHGAVHLERVVATAMKLAAEEGARLEIVLPAAWLHDCVHVAKDSPDRPRASQLAAEHAARFLEAAGYPAACLPDIRHAIEAHSFRLARPRTSRRESSRRHTPDAPALSPRRCIAVGAALDRPLYERDDPFCRSRTPDDRGASLDHFYAKLLKLAGTMQTRAGRREAERRTDFLRGFIAQLETEIGA
jgi:uncharacterized protein